MLPQIQPDCAARVRQIGELRDEIRYQQGLQPEARESDYLRDIMKACLKVFDDYLGLAPADEYKVAREAVYPGP